MVTFIAALTATLQQVLGPSLRQYEHEPIDLRYVRNSSQSIAKSSAPGRMQERGLLGVG
jgi:hypothetical protein